MPVIYCKATNCFCEVYNPAPSTFFLKFCGGEVLTYSAYLNVVLYKLLIIFLFPFLEFL